MITHMLSIDWLIRRRYRQWCNSRLCVAAVSVICIDSVIRRSYEQQVSNLYTTRCTQRDGVVYFSTQVSQWAKRKDRSAVYFCVGWKPSLSRFAAERAREDVVWRHRCERSVCAKPPGVAADDAGQNICESTGWLLWSAVGGLLPDAVPTRSSRVLCQRRPPPHLLRLQVSSLVHRSSIASILRASFICLISYYWQLLLWHEMALVCWLRNWNRKKKFRNSPTHWIQQVTALRKTVGIRNLFET